MSFYGTEAAADAYHTERGNSAWDAFTSPQQEAALTRASDYLDRFFVQRLSTGSWVVMWSGEKTDPAQAREWPRDSATYYGTAVTDGTTPTAIEHATYEAALREATTPGSLMPDFTPGNVIQETVGPLTVKYSDKEQSTERPPNMPVLPVVERLVAGYLVPRAVLPAVRVV